jgi:hypothetical protein
MTPPYSPNTLALAQRLRQIPDIPPIRDVLGVKTLKHLHAIIIQLVFEDVHPRGMRSVDEAGYFGDGELDGLGEEVGDCPVAGVAVPGDGDQAKDGFGDEPDSVVELSDRQLSSSLREHCGTHISKRRPPEGHHQTTRVVDHLHSEPDFGHDLLVGERGHMLMTPGVATQMASRCLDLAELVGARKAECQFWSTGVSGHLQLDNSAANHCERGVSASSNPIVATHCYERPRCCAL